MAFVSTMAVVAFWCDRQRRSRTLFLADLVLALACLAAARSQSCLVIVAVLVPTLIALERPAIDGQRSRRVVGRLGQR
jgi:uncharacterized membrane protein YhfC